MCVCVLVCLSELLQWHQRGSHSQLQLSHVLGNVQPPTLTEGPDLSRHTQRISTHVRGAPSAMHAALYARTYTVQVSCLRDTYVYTHSVSDH